MTEFYAQPYSIEHGGFYFDSVEKLEAGMERLSKQGYEEVEIQFIDGEEHHSRLAEALRTSQLDVENWFIYREDCDEVNADQFAFLFDLGYDIEEAVSRYEDVCTYGGTAPITPTRFSGKPAKSRSTWSTTSTTTPLPAS